jgi:hypothetical protein
MKPFESKGYNKYGADMGRRSEKPTIFGAGRVRLQKVELDRGGYDNGGAYWGSGVQLWCAWTNDGEFTSYLRAPTRAGAVAEIRRTFPEVKFFRE